MQTVYATPKTNLQNLFDGLSPQTTVVLKEGVYKQKLEINVSDITIKGEGNVVIEYDDYAKKLDDKGVEYNTFRTYTVAVCADNVSFFDLTISNKSLNPAVKGQEVALSVLGDNFKAQNCTLFSTQDTLFCGPLPYDLVLRYDGFLKDKLRIFKPCKQFYINCTIYGSVDFIFGTGDCLFENCNIINVYDGRNIGFVAAPAHSLEQDIGFVFDGCNFTAREDVEAHSIYLARPWRDYGKCSFINCTYADHIMPCGFDKWNDTERDKTARFYEYGCDRSQRVSWSKALDSEEVEILRRFFK